VKLEAVCQAMVRAGLVRKSINRHLDRIKRMFRWAGKKGLVGQEVYHKLQCVAGLSEGRTAAKESDPVQPVPDAFVDAVRPFVSRQVKALIDLQLRTAARPGELCIMRGCDLETSGTTWIYRPERHKNQHRGRGREIYLGPRAQRIVKEFLRTDTQAYLFSPWEAREELYRELRAARKFPVQPSQACRRSKAPERVPGQLYTTKSYARAIARACEKAFPAPDHLTEAEILAWKKDHHWHPHQLRHNAATQLRKEHGIELARIVLGHSTAFTTEIYALQDRQAAQEVIAKIG